MAAGLTERQLEVLRFVERTIAGRGVAPTLREIAAAFGFSSTASAQKHLLGLERKGYLSRSKHQKRGLTLAGARHPPASEAVASVPLLGVVAAGSPIEAVADRETVALPAALVDSGEHFALRVRGDSMVEDGIHDGDLVVVRSRTRARDGEMVVALVSGEVTLKRLYRDGGGLVRLQPANADLRPLVVPGEDVRVQGIVVALLRRY
jgi:repressor LexA